MNCCLFHVRSFNAAAGGGVNSARPMAARRRNRHGWRTGRSAAGVEVRL